MNRCGERLVPRLYAHLNPMPIKDAAKMEKRLAAEYGRIPGVWGNLTASGGLRIADVGLGLRIVDCGLWIGTRITVTCFPRVTFFVHVVVDQLLERRGQLVVGAAQRRGVLAVDEDGAVGRLAGAGQARCRCWRPSIRRGR